MNSEALRGQARHGEDRWRRFSMRGVMVVGFSLTIAVILTAMGDTLGLSVVYSLCIGLLCWLFIDLGGDLVAARLSLPLFGSEAARAGWIGWAWMVVTVVVGATLGYACGNALANALTGMHKPGPFNANFGEMKTVLLMAFLPAVTISYFLISREVIATQKAEVEAARRQAAEQQLKLLESQLEPHMLFNTLANLRALIGIDPTRAQAMLDQLIAFLRASLDGSRARTHSLAAEFQRLHDYLALMQVRMGPRLDTRFDLPPDLAAARVPPLLLQPLVENSIKHGLEPQIAGGRIDIGAAREGDALVLRVRDSGAGVDASSLSAEGHYGLAHVRERLATLYGERASFELEAGDGGTLATIRLPWRTTDDNDRGRAS
jgi:two-component sensor histidine kinase